jgi:mannose-1-phosphate guanylyltransferase/mannose-6-phosphate isomerase
MGCFLRAIVLDEDVSSTRGSTVKSIIIAGGSGTHLFPLTRTHVPKQFVKFFGSASLFRLTLERALIFSAPDEIYVVTSEAYKSLVHDELNDICKESKVLVLPEIKNPMPAIYDGMQQIDKDWGVSNVEVLPSDNYVHLDERYAVAIRQAEQLADDYLITFGIRPTYPSTTCGYIEPGNAIGKGPGFRIQRFVEDADLDRAKQEILCGSFWNCRMYLFNTDLFRREREQHVHDLVDTLQHPPAESAAPIPQVSIEGIMAKTERAAMLPLNALWSDIGSFDALYKLEKKDAEGNAVRGRHVGIESSGNLIIGDRLIGTAGIHNLAIVETKDALIVCPRDQSQHVDRITAALSAQKDTPIDYPATINRPWGSSTLIDDGPSHKIRRVTVHTNKKQPLQVHQHRSERWVVVAGVATVLIGGKESILRPRESTVVPEGVKHRLENRGKIPLEVIEIQNGDYVGEDDT